MIRTHCLCSWLPCYAVSQNRNQDFENGKERLLWSRTSNPNILIRLRRWLNKWRIKRRTVLCFRILDLKVNCGMERPSAIVKVDNQREDCCVGENQCTEIKRSAEKNSSPESHCQFFLVLVFSQVKIIQWNSGELLELLGMLLILEVTLISYFHFLRVMAQRITNRLKYFAIHLWHC